MIIHGETANEIHINTIDVPDLPKGAVAVHCALFEIETDLVLLLSPNANSAKRAFYTGLQEALSYYSDEQQFALLEDFNCVEHLQDRSPFRSLMQEGTNYKV